MRWTVSERDVECGSCSDPIPPNQPIALLTAKNLVRCRRCAGAPVNKEEVDNERFRIERDHVEGEAARLRRFEPLPLPRHRRTMQPLSAAASGVFDFHDPKMAAAGRDE